MEYVQKLAENGLLGVLLAIAYAAIFVLYKALIVEKDKRLDDKEKWLIKIDDFLNNIMKIKNGGGE